MLRQIQPEQTGKPQYRADGNGREEELGVVQKGERVVPQKRDYEVVVQRDEVERVSQR